MASSDTTAASAEHLPDIRKLLAGLVRALDDKKAEDLKVLYVGEQSTITDFLVLATGMADPHLRALRREAERVLKNADMPIAGLETTEGSGWLVFDAYQIMVHLFMREQRENYQLEQLWRDAKELDIAELLASAPAEPGETRSETNEPT